MGEIEVCLSNRLNSRWRTIDCFFSLQPLKIISNMETEIDIRQFYYKHRKFQSVICFNPVEIELMAFLKGVLKYNSNYILSEIEIIIFLFYLI